MNKNKSAVMRGLMKCDRKTSSKNVQICRISKLTPGTTYIFDVLNKNVDDDSWEYANISSIEVTTDNPSGMKISFLNTLCVGYKVFYHKYFTEKF